MKLRELIYCHMSDKFLGRRIDMLSKELNNANTSEKRMKIFEEETDIMKALLYKHRDDKEFIRMARRGLEELLDKYKPVIDENKES